MRLLAWALGSLGGLLCLLGLSWFGYGLYVERVVAEFPSTLSVVNTAQGAMMLGSYSEGDQLIPGDQAPIGTLATPPATRGSDMPLAREAATPTATPRPSRPALPPTRLLIPKIGVDALVVLADNDNLPRFKGVGWYIGTGYPGFRGNVVLFGHLNGDFETFARLDELQPGDEVVVQAMDRTYGYTVTGSRLVPKDAVEVMAPTRDYSLTLITCTGTFYPATRDYSHRLVVSGALNEQQPVARQLHPATD